MEEEIPTKESKNLIKLLRYSKNLEIIPWKENEDAVGVSIIREYPDNGKFKPTRNIRGKKDSVAMIRVWYLKSEIVKYRNQSKVRLQVSISKASRYLFNHIFNNSDDPDSPTESSIEISKRSTQPVDLIELNRYTLINFKIINDVKNNYEIKSKVLIEDIYREHLDTTTNYLFRTKIFLRQSLVDLMDPLKKKLLKANAVFFGKLIKEEKDDLFKGVFSPYSYTQLIDNPDSLKMKILGSDIPISYNTAITFTSFITILYLLKYFLSLDLLGVISFIESINNAFFLAVLTVQTLWLFDFVIPRLILYFANLLIKIYLHLIDLRVKT